jgi:hypothetical protein
MQPTATGAQPATSDAQLPAAESGARSWTRLALTLAARAAVRPRLAIDMLRVAWRFRSRGWYRRFPFLPLPSADYVRWRMHTAYGDPATVPPPDDVIRYARWVAGRR